MRGNTLLLSSNLKTGFQAFDILLPLWQNWPFSFFNAIRGRHDGWLFAICLSCVVRCDREWSKLFYSWTIHLPGIQLVCADFKVATLVPAQTARIRKVTSTCMCTCLTLNQCARDVCSVALCAGHAITVATQVWRKDYISSRGAVWAVWAVSAVIAHVWVVLINVNVQQARPLAHTVYVCCVYVCAQQGDMKWMFTLEIVHLHLRHGVFTFRF